MTNEEIEELEWGEEIDKLCAELQGLHVWKRKCDRKYWTYYQHEDSFGPIEEPSRVISDTFTFLQWANRNGIGVLTSYEESNKVFRVICIRYWDSKMSVSIHPLLQCAICKAVLKIMTEEIN